MTNTQGGFTARAAVPLGFGVAIDANTEQLDDASVFGGFPARVLRLSASGQAALAELQAGTVRTVGGARLARRLFDTGLAHPRPPAVSGRFDVTVVIPVRDRAELLDQCLAALERAHPVVVVDDGSADPEAIAKVAAAHGASVVRRDSSVGPGAARDIGLWSVDTEFVAFLDSDCISCPEWVTALGAHFADPAVAVVAPRVRSLTSGSWFGRYAEARGGLDLGPREARALPLSPVSYVPTAALVARRSALETVARGGIVFDPALRWGEDVDLVWRLTEGGWTVRYDPAVTVRHRDPDGMWALLVRRFRYGTSAGPLAVRHPQAMTPLSIAAGPGVCVAGVLAARPAVAALGLGWSVASLRRGLRRAGLPQQRAPRAAANGAWHTWLGVGRYVTQFGPPLVGLAWATFGRSARRGTGRRLALGALVLAGPIRSWRATQPELDPLRYCAAYLADEIAYGAGVWHGAVSAHTAVPLRPVLMTRRARPERTRPQSESPRHQKRVT